MTSARRRIRELRDMAEYGGIDVLFDYVLQLEREVERLRHAKAKRAARAAPRSGETAS